MWKNNGMEQTIKEDSNDMCQCIIAAVASKFIDAATEEHQQLDITFLLPRYEDECKRITISHDKEQESNYVFVSFFIRIKFARQTAYSVSEPVGLQAKV